MTKLAKSKFPISHSPDDFKCFGPPATKDGEFTGTCIADFGCFEQRSEETAESDNKAIDSNKFYHAAVVQSKKDTSKWYLYVEYGRVGATNPQFQFTEFSSQSEAQSAYEKQCHEKNDKRGQWVQHKVLGKILQPKAGKDCYLVRPQATRSTGLPDAKTITSVSTPTVSIPTSSKGTTNIDSITNKLLTDLNVGTISYTRSSMVGNALPTKEALDEGRLILSHAQTIINKQSTAKSDIKELEELSKLLYSRIPKVKSLSNTNWVLDPNNIFIWQNDIDAYEAALIAFNQSDTKVKVSGFDNLGYEIRHIPTNDSLYNWVANFWVSATRNVHSYISGKLKVINLFEIKRTRPAFQSYLASKGIKNTREVPLHQPSKRQDTNNDENKIFANSKTWMLFHGTRSCNVSGIMREHFRLPQTLSGVAFSGANFGSGTYFADDIKKSVGYTSYDRSYWAGGSGGIKDRGAFMFICDVMIGVPNLVTRSGGYQGPGNGYDSIYAKGGVASVSNNEFVVFDPKMSNLRYLVEFS